MYSPNLFGAMPMQMPQQNAVGFNGFAQPVQQASPAPLTLMRVNGADGAKAYQMPPNSMVALFDANEDVFFLKVSDGNGFCTTTPYRFERIEDQIPTKSEYVTRAELQKALDELKGAMINHAE